MTNTDTNTDYVNAGRLTLMRWTYAAVILFFCCLDESRTFFVVASVVHALIFAMRFLNRDVTYHASIIRKTAEAEKDKFVQDCYDREIEKQKPCWFSQFAVYAFVGDKAAIVAPIVSKRLEEIWQAGFNDGSDTVELDVNISTVAASRPSRSDSFELEIW